MRKALLGFILAALFVGGSAVAASAQTSGSPPPPGQGNAPSLADAKAELQDVEDVIVITETTAKAKKESPPASKPAPAAPAPQVAAPPPPKVDPQQVENLKILRDQLRTKIERAERASNPAEAQVLLKDAILQAEAARSLKQSVAGVPSGSAGVVERAIMQKFGSQALEQLRAVDQGFRRTGNNDGRGAASSHTIYDVAKPRAGAAADPVNPRPDRLMQGNFGGGAAAPAPAPVRGNFKPVTVETARKAVDDYGSQFGGVVLEGTGAGLPAIHKIEYNRMANALVANDRSVYFSPVPAPALAILARAIAADDRVGVSLGSTHVVTKSLPAESEIALDLKIADHFLGDIVFARPEWTRGYRFRNGFAPQPHTGSDFDVAVYFMFNGFAFSVEGEELRGVQAGFDVSLVPLSGKKAGDGGHLPDEDAILRRVGSAQYEANARHVADNIDYYRREKLIEIVFAYGEVTALLRAMKANGRDLTALASTIETVNGFTATEAARSTPAPASRPATAPAAAPAGPGLWDHNNSVMSLEASGATRRFYYRQPREGMLRAGAQAGSLLFDGRQSGQQITGTAYIFAGSCGQKPYQVQGEVRGDGSIVMRGFAPRIDRSTCQPVDTRADELVFTPRGAAAVAASGPGLWDHNGSAMALQMSGSTIRFLYQQPRPGMLQAGAQPGSLLFDGQRSGTQIWGTAYVFSRSCGPQPYSVQGEIVDNGAGVVMRGAAPRVDPRTCTLVDTRPDELVFRPGPSVPRPEVVQMQNHWAAYLKRIQERNQYPNWSAPPHDLYQGGQTGRG